MPGLTGQSISMTMGTAFAVATEPRCGYVALLDALGFRDLIARDRNNEKVINYIGTVGRAVQECGLPAIAFSDTVVLTIEGEGPDALLEMVKACSLVLGRMISAHIPVRGAIAFGAYVQSKSIADSHFLAGPPILDAYHFEQQQDWVGVLLAPSAAATVKEHNLRQSCNRRLTAPPASYRQQLEWNGYLQAVDKVPFHEPPSPNNYKGLAVVPGGSDDLEALCESLDRMIEALNWMQVMAPSPREQRKHQATIGWLSEARQDWGTHLEEYRSRPT